MADNKIQQVVETIEGLTSPTGGTGQGSEREVRRDPHGVRGGGDARGGRGPGRGKAEEKTSSP